MQNNPASTGSKSFGLISLVVPFYNEEGSVEELIARLVSELEKVGRPFEILLIDDGSSDRGPALVTEFAATDSRVRLISFTRNFGKAAALSAGFQRASGEVIITMDADLQDDPAEITNFLFAIDEGFDVVSGWKKIRHDPIGKTLPSKVFNLMLQKTFDLDINDFNCGFKAYSRRAAKSLNLYGELHRFTPALANSNGFTVTEITVQHHARVHGESKYGISRLFKGLLDLITVKLMTTYSTRPLHFFGMVAMPLGFLGGLILVYLTTLWFLDMGPIGNRPLLLIGILFVITATQLIGIGLTAELLQTKGLSEQDKYIVDSDTGDQSASRNSQGT